ncbi:hypothetical protein [uncultured Clostridium sp.]|uniref:hypothetical protein n=1 Tax=uncultured Clostridium sp. TaxID=59620 RepID=UPI00263512A0|nr:hypothetical protein [uncultured Clostridium sp.]
MDNMRKEEYGDFNLLLIFNKKLEVIELVNFSNRCLKDNIFNKDLFYVELEEALFFEIKKLLLTNTLRLTKDPIKEKITIKDIEKTPLPPKPPTPEEAMNNGLLAVTMGVGELNMKIHAISDGMLNQVEERSELKKQIEALNGAVLMLTMKLGGK